ncbi:hypothetical protein ACFFSH_37505 [Streptomyces filamentosus]|uniref:Uncharacterized protein n=1 Tax=Streptomyces filamentosus TaxID=67294 RepID=A0A919ER32_STRFL|nr:hypothetical protein [Streptomyces filamentosus]GHG10613.1 hypothetical protein GCM10017667_49190 [Streptomyces filamentosus]
MPDEEADGRGKTRPGPEERWAGRAYSARFHLLDRQVVDGHDRPVCKVDDLELEPDPGGPPRVTAVLVGPAALAPRLGGKAARWLAAVQRRLSVGEGEGPARLDFGRVSGIGAVVRVDLPEENIEVHALEDWMRENVVGRLPGAGHASG